MSEHRESECEPQEPEPKPDPAPGESGYYYDDTTGYEIYDPTADDEDED